MDEFAALTTACQLHDLERATFEAIGSMVARVSDPSLKIRLAEVSRHSAWRSEQWAALIDVPLPVALADQLSPLGRVVLEAPPAGHDGAAVWAWLGVVLSELVSASDAVVAAGDQVGDAPTLRVAARVLADLRLDQVG